MNIDLTTIIRAIIGVIAAFLTYRVIPMIKAKTSNEQRQQIAAALRIAVYAAEQIYGAGHGEEKMDFAIKYMRDNGYDVDKREIEAAVGMYLNPTNFINGLVIDDPVVIQDAKSSVDVEKPVD